VKVALLLLCYASVSGCHYLRGPLGRRIRNLALDLILYFEFVQDDLRCCLRNVPHIAALVK
jgi:hypothetical protein